MRLIVFGTIVLAVLAILIGSIWFGLWVTWYFVLPVLFILLIYGVPATCVYYIAYRVWKEFKA